jgi:hypothetical protein
VISLDMDAAAGEIVPGSTFQMPLKVYVPPPGPAIFTRSRDKVLLSVFPWAGAEYDITRGDISFVVDPPGPGSIPVDESVDDETWYGLAGVSVSATIMHFIDLQAKYKLTFNGDDRLHTFDAMANVFFTRHWGVSYRFKHMQLLPVPPAITSAESLRILKGSVEAALRGDAAHPPGLHGRDAAVAQVAVRLADFPAGQARREIRVADRGPA